MKRSRLTRLCALVFATVVLACTPYIQASAVIFDRNDLDDHRKRIYDVENGIYFVGGVNCDPNTANGTLITPDAAVTPAGAPPDDYTQVQYGGVTLNKRTVAMLETAKSVYGKSIPLTQGSYNAGGVAASAGTHDRGGAVDVAVNGASKEVMTPLIRALRIAGFAAWYRTVAEGNGTWSSAHIHAIAIGDKELSPGAASQVKSYFAGKNGLSGDGPDTSADIGRPIPDWAKQFGTASGASSAAATSTTSSTVCCPTGTGTGVTVDVGQIEGETGKKAFVFLVQNGLTADQAAGVIGNLMAESGGNTVKLDPKAVNPGSGAYGIAQWMGPRKTKLQALPNFDTIDVQIKYLWDELNGAYKSSVLDPIKSANRETATQIFLERFEVPCVVTQQRPDACLSYYNERIKNANTAYNAFSGLTGGAVASISSGSGCQNNSVNIDGYVWPLQIPNKADMYNGYKLPCTSRCHHDGTPAFDLANKGYSDPANVGTVVVAITSGKIDSIKVDTNNGGCSSIQFLGDDGYYYWYGHTLVNESTPPLGQHIEAGTPISKIGPPRCNNGGAAHLHIDRGSPKGKTGGSMCCRDEGFIQVMNNIYNKTPDSGGVSPL